MEKVTNDTIKHVAKLAKLEFSDEELTKFTPQMGKILEMAEELQAVNTDGVEETVQVVDRDTVFRDDVPEKWQTRDEMMKNVPDKSNGFVKVPVIIDKDDDQ
ncbi:Aspartyl/glutamyl-tRNA(Asn/Gln) amidotransferase subunit C [Lactobacillus equicursoris DSM 19284 = JCM 14600 = CIP 110162]|uniref:Aspartyl/glutamyl-tRNA(Asn/Gln) amidotransferase subunit C n=2 Tax=Lactobacillus equicursoris TaxID=420645 RepID=K0NW98_9LACO|nr:Asp-tRNA(Asn)/Glu-tRNA(Gln) amidotransferase subunit GatC [Lactobacillus equicursoris]KRL02761.1 glutamyl-tRNA(Gln) amidotransferase, C subunit [Lactobacillus equicursoris DSM 19284 = JCM 14600 = CIP 110162]MDD6386781.1 Asp-tRNA(Asn)/Glu-tRNA(Gln) amidotransferase subunit GatC [Lactobacillus equicursoris]MDD6406556.1 Asp-tRNA(Asn)/Glu-tRNA(Gln) amidotransferase subunit GatC [Lactobacillus equicursoris]MST78937.1 Asp-tRNA(Asn)/Glu-tRNA(Gln) amidotransferase subunit GatC [Lactobacillus equicur